MAELFATIARAKKIELTAPLLSFIRDQLGSKPLTGSDVEAILVRAKERAVLAGRDHDVQLADLEEAVNLFIDPLDPDLLALQELAAVLVCSDRPARAIPLERPRRPARGIRHAQTPRRAKVKENPKSEVRSSKC